MYDFDSLQDNFNYCIKRNIRPRFIFALCPNRQGDNLKVNDFFSFIIHEQKPVFANLIMGEAVCLFFKRKKRSESNHVYGI